MVKQGSGIFNIFIAADIKVRQYLCNKEMKNIKDNSKLLLKYDKMKIINM